MSGRIRVVFFHIGVDVLGGGSKMLLRLVRSLDEDRFDPVLISQFNDELCERARDHGITVQIVPFQGALDTYNRQLLTKSPTTLIRTGVRIAQFNVDSYSFFRDADIVWCQNLRAILTLFPYIVASRTPVIWNIGLGIESTGHLRYLHSLALRVSDYIFIESDEQARRVFTENQYYRHQHKFVTFYKGIDTDTFDPQSVEGGLNVTDKIRIGTAASLIPRKGLDYFIEAIPPLLEKHDDVAFFIAGEATDGRREYEQQLRERTKELGIEDDLTFLGWVEDMPRYLKSLDVFVLPSLNEGIPGSVREALAMETPVVATDVGGTRDVVIDHRTGILVEPENSNELVRAIDYLLENPEERRDMGSQGRTLITDQFSVKEYIRNYEDFLLNIAQKH